MFKMSSNFKYFNGKEWVSVGSKKEDYMMTYSELKLHLVTCRFDQFRPHKEMIQFANIPLASCKDLEINKSLLRDLKLFLMCHTIPCMIGYGKGLQVSIDGSLISILCSEEKISDLLALLSANEIECVDIQKTNYHEYTVVIQNALVAFVLSPDGVIPSNWWSLSSFYYKDATDLLNTKNFGLNCVFNKSASLFLQYLLLLGTGLSTKIEENGDISYVYTKGVDTIIDTSIRSEMGDWLKPVLIAEDNTMFCIK